MAAPFQNYGDGTFLGDLVTRPEFLQYIQEEVYHRCKWIQSGVVSRNSALDCRAGGTRVRVPFFQVIPEIEEQIQSNNTWGDSAQGYLTPRGITGDEQVMTILHRGGAWAADDLSRLGTGADPMAAIASYMTKTLLKLRTRTLLSQLTGILDGALAANDIDVSTAAAGAVEANFLSAASVIRGRNALGERGEDLSVIAMHSDVYSYLLQVGALTFSTAALATGGEITWGGGGVGLRAPEVAYFMGLRVIVDDLLAPTVNAGGADQYPVFLMGESSVNEGVQQEFRTEYDRNILSKQNVMSWDHHYGFHLYGTSWVGAGDNPTNAELATDTNWNLVYGAAGTGNAGFGAQLVPCVRLTVNTPFAANV